MSRSKRKAPARAKATKKTPAKAKASKKKKSSRTTTAAPSARKKSVAKKRTVAERAGATAQRDRSPLSGALTTAYLIGQLERLDEVEETLSEVARDLATTRKLLRRQIERVKTGRKSPDRQPSLSVAEARWMFEREYVKQILELTNGNQSEAARRAGMSRSAFRELMKRVDLVSLSEDFAPGIVVTRLG